MSTLADRSCVPGAARLSVPARAGLTPLVPAWAGGADGAELVRTFHFRDYHHTLAFVNAVAWIAHQEDHHPDLSVHYNRVVVRWSTHDAGGLTENDFICAAKVDALGGGRPGAVGD